MVKMTVKESNPFGFLKTKEIIAILDGDTKYNEYEFDDGTSVTVVMPYLSGPDLCDISTLFGLPMTYTRGGTNLSRWQYLDNLMEYCMKENRCSDLLSYLFAKERFAKTLSGHGADEIYAAYTHISNEIIQKINGILFFGGNELAVIGNALKKQIETEKAKQKSSKDTTTSLNEIMEIVNSYNGTLTQFDDVVIRKVVEYVKVISSDKIQHYLYS